jgi:microcystin degradation protein MlrC
VRILVGSLAHESNTFTSLPTTLADFGAVYGRDTLQMPVHDALAGIVATLGSGTDIELVPTLWAHALPAGRVERRAFERLKETILAQAHDIDGVCLFLHGAMRAEGIDYCESELLAALRERLGPEVPITVAMDMHANVVRDMVRNADAIAAYHTAPHVDTFETGERAARILLQTLKGRIDPEMAFAKIPMLLPGEMAQTGLDPMASMMGLLKEIEARPGVVDASLVKTHCWADVPDQGISAVVVTDGDAPLARREADRLAAAFWARRHEFGFSAETRPVDEAIRVAMDAPESTVYLSDSGDNATAGGSTDITVVLRALIDQQAQDAVIAAIWDVEAVDACMAAGVGKEVTLSLGGKVDSVYGPPLEATGTVRTLSDGRYYRGGVRAPENLVERGPIAVWRVGGIDAVLCRARISIVEPAQLRSLGIEPQAFKIVVLKVGYLHAPFQEISSRSILMLSPGPTNCDVTQLPYSRVRRPIYPLDRDAAWSPAGSAL